MGCGFASTPKLYFLDVFNSTTNRVYYYANTGSKATSFVRTVTIPSVPRSRPEYACVRAESTIKIVAGDSKTKNFCFPIASPF
jgi:hypothetical protein